MGHSHDNEIPPEGEQNAPQIRLEGLWSESACPSAAEWAIFSDRAERHDFAAQTSRWGLASWPRGVRLRFVQGRAPSPDGFGETTPPIGAASEPEALSQGLALATERENDEQMQIRTHEASDRARHVVATRRLRRNCLELGVFAIALGVTATSAVWAKRGGIEFSAPALAAVDLIPAHASQTHAAAEPAPAHETTTVHAAPAPEFVVDEIVEIDPADAEIRYFDNRPVRPVRVIWMVTTAYSPDERSCGKWADGITASNRSVWTNGMKLVAADTKVLKMHSLVSIPGYHDAEIVPVLDRGGAIKGNKLDLLYPTHERALQWGRQRLPVTVYEYAD
ncbi:MAG: 3D domain-containing protein [Phycisphaeraceae bacterium]|nr:3D domain-containing protein [Phycisphaeraceae bacterium]